MTGKIEMNEVRMTGVIPSYKADPIPVGKIPDHATQLVASNGANDSEVSIHQVTAGKLLYLSHYTVNGLSNSAVVHLASLQVRNDGGGLVYVIAQSYVWNTFGFAVSGSFLPPLVISSGWNINVVSDHADCVVYGFIHGYEI